MTVEATATGAPERMRIAGELVDAASGETLDVINPATGEILTTTPAGGSEDVDRAVRAARRAFEDGPWPRMEPSQRAKLIHRFADQLEARMDDLFRLETLNNGRPVRETRAQVGRLPEWFRYNAALLLADRTDVVPMSGPYLNYLLRHPLGVCGLLTPFNHPLMILAKSLAPAIATGNTVVVKPSELTPLTTLELTEIAAEAGIPDGVINVVTGTGASAGKALAEHPDVARLTFTGSTEVGRSIGVAAAQRLARATTELGGKSPVLIFEDAGLERAVKGAAFGAFIAAGQTCICGARIIVQESIYDQVVEGLAATASAIRLGDPSEESTQMGPIVSDRQRQRVLGYVEIGTEEGGRVVVGGGVPRLEHPLDKGFFVEPTVIADVENEMRVAQEEIFGPVAVVIPFSDEADALRKANDIRFGLGSALWTRDIARAHRVAAQIEAGMVWINDHHRLDPSSPWGGLKDSGVGREGGWESFHEFTEIQSITVRVAEDDADWYGTDAPVRLN
jgi:acyl-CoA reductase-like NAD-dependent aldehyde dehydrogenase